MRWSYWTYPRLTLHINTLSRSSITLNRRRENLDVRIQSKGKEPETTKQRENPRRVDLGHPIEVVRKYPLHEDRERHRKMCEFYKIPTHNTSYVEPRSH